MKLIILIISVLNFIFSFSIEEKESFIESFNDDIDRAIAFIDNHKDKIIEISKDYNIGFSQFLRIHNLLNKDYAERADFNAFGGDRYFPGIPRQIFLGLEYSF